MKRRLTYLVCTLILVFAISACGDGNVSSSPSPTAEPTNTPSVTESPNINAGAKDDMYDMEEDVKDEIYDMEDEAKDYVD